jgi:hypothetical protein
MKTKYVAHTEWVKALKLPGFLAQFLDSLNDRIGRTIDNTSMRDWVYVITFLSAVYVAYYTIKTVEPKLPMFSFFGAVMALFSPKPPQETGIDVFVLATAVVVAYEVTQISASDIASAVSKLGPLMAAIP